MAIPRFLQVPPVRRGVTPPASPQPAPMKIRLSIAQARGIAMIIVMIVIIVLGVLAGGFAYSMKVETKLAQNSGFEADLEWLGRSGVELARYILVQEMNVPANHGIRLTKNGRAGRKEPTRLLEMVSLENNELGPGMFSIKIIDLERKVNINLINEVSVPCSSRP